MWNLHVKYSVSAVEHICSVGDIFVQGHMPIMWNICIPVVWSHYWLQWVHVRFIYLEHYLISVHEVVDICGIYLTFEGHVCWWHIYGNSMVIKSCNLLYFWLEHVVIWDLYVDYSICAEGYNMQCGRHICSGEYASNMKCMHSSASVHIIDCIDFFLI